MRSKIVEMEAEWSKVLDQCNILDENWKTFAQQINQENTINNSSWWRQACVLIKGQPTLEGHMLYLKHVVELKSKIETLKDIKNTIVTNLDFIDRGVAAEGEVPDEELKEHE